MTSGSLRQRLTFQSPAPHDDGYGNAVAGFEAQFTYWAEVKPLVGGETVLASRLAGTQPVRVRVRASSDTRRIRADWRAVHAHTGVIYQMKSPTADVDSKNAYLDFLAEVGVAA